jgi:hypothetical protein
VKKKDWDYIAKLEKEISKRYGPEAVQSPRSTWDDEKERDYLVQIKEFDKKVLRMQEQSEKIELNGLYISKRFLKRSGKYVCPVCSVYSTKPRDDMYMSKFECCHRCYIEWVEDREERWTSGWRPTQTIK